MRQPPAGVPAPAEGGAQFTDAPPPLTFGGGAFRAPTRDVVAPSAHGIDLQPLPAASAASAADETQDVMVVENDDDVESMISASSSSSYGRPTRSRSSRARRRRHRYDVESTICSSGFSDIRLPSGGPEIEKVLAVRRKGGNDEYLIKLKKRSYAKVRWWSKDEAINTLDSKKLQAGAAKYLEQHRVPAMIDHEPDHQLFPVDYTVMDRVVAKNAEGTKALILWRMLNYASCTWEPIGEVPKRLLDRYERFQKKQFVEPVETPTLREYQTEGVEWLMERFRQRQGGILADEMGLGKTIQVVMFLNKLYTTGETKEGTLVVVPLQVLQHWRDEFAKWGVLNVVCFQGGKEDRVMCAAYEVFRRRDVGGKKRYDVVPHVVITTYETIIAAEPGGPLRSKRWRVTIFDEAHRLKNEKTAAWGVARTGITSPSKYLLTGTPVQNNTEELWALLHIACPVVFPAKKAEKDAFVSALSGRGCLVASVESLKEKMAPFLLRREKQDVLSDELPDRADVHLNVPLTSVQKQLYAAVLQRNEAFLRGHMRGKWGNIVMQLRFVCNHPYLIEGQRAWVEAHMPRANAQGSRPQLPSLIACSAKLTVLDKLLAKWRSEQRKVLIFSQFKVMLNLVQDMLDLRGWQFARLDGSVKKQDKDRDMARFKRNPDCFVFLLTTRAGGVGLNLIQADRVVIFDSDWNPQADLQAAARSHRIGQQKEVKIYRFIAHGTLEERMVDTASRKLALSTTLLQNQDSAPASDGELRDFLRYGAYQMMRAAAEARKQQAERGDRFEDEDEALLYSSSADAILDKAEEGASHSKAVDKRGDGGVAVGDIKNFSEITLSDANSVSADEEDKFWTALFASSTLADAPSPPPQVPPVSQSPEPPGAPAVVAASAAPAAARPSPTLSLTFNRSKRRRESLTPPPTTEGACSLERQPEKRARTEAAPPVRARGTQNTMHPVQVDATAPSARVHQPKASLAVSPSPMTQGGQGDAVSSAPKPTLHLTFGTRKRPPALEGEAEKKVKRDPKPATGVKPAPKLQLTFGKKKTN